MNGCPVGLSNYRPLGYLQVLKAVSWRTDYNTTVHEGQLENERENPGVPASPVC
jgi:hypothetical protein